MEDNLIYLDTYVLQQDMRVRMPKAVLSNLGIEKGKSKFDIYLNTRDKCLILKKHNTSAMEGDDNE